MLRKGRIVLRPKPGEPMVPQIDRTANQKRKPLWRWLANLLLGLVIVALALGVSKYIRDTAPKAKKQAPATHIPMVESIALYPGDHQVLINAMGTVVPAKEVIVKSRVSGQVQSLHAEFTEGGFIGEGERILKIDPRDYELALVRKKSQLVDAQYSLKLEMGHQEVAKREWSILNEGKSVDPADAELALRKPHLAKIRSDVATAEAELEQAKLSLSRTDIKAPFNALVSEKHVDIGSQVSTQDALAHLVGTDEYWIRVSLPVDRLRWIRIPLEKEQKGAEATVHFRGHERSGRVVRMLGDLETQGRMARLLVSVKDPLVLDRPLDGVTPLLIGEYVHVTIQGKQLSDVYRIPRSTLRDNNTVWLLDEEDRLRIQPVEAVWRDETSVLIGNHLSPGDRLVTSALATPADGLRVQTKNRAAGKGPIADTVKDERDDS